MSYYFLAINLRQSITLATAWFSQNNCDFWKYALIQSCAICLTIGLCLIRSYSHSVFLFIVPLSTNPNFVKKPHAFYGFILVHRSGLRITGCNSELPRTSWSSERGRTAEPSLWLMPTTTASEPRPTEREPPASSHERLGSLPITRYRLWFLAYFRYCIGWVPCLYEV